MLRLKPLVDQGCNLSDRAIGELAAYRDCLLKPADQPTAQLRTFEGMPANASDGSTSARRGPINDGPLRQLKDRVQ